MNCNFDLDITIPNIRKAQTIAKKCLEELPLYIRPGISRSELHQICENIMTKAGSTGWWMRGDGALILFGPHTTFSAHDSPDALFKDLTIGENDVVTVDVAPMFEDGWGDMARTFVIESGHVIPWENSSNEEIKEGMRMEERLHKAFVDNFSPDMTFSSLHALTSRIMDSYGYRNCDYHGNFGHTIEAHPDNRVTIIPEETRSIFSYGKPITFEPHICRIGGTIGVKCENIYYWDTGKLEVL